MRLLLDTHIWIWSHSDPSRIAPPVAAELEGEAELWLSAVSCWEVMLLAQRGRIDLDPAGPSWVRRALEVRPMVDAPLSREVAIRSREIDPGTNDPADRFLAATAIVHDLVLVTSDRHLIDCKDVPTLANR